MKVKVEAYPDKRWEKQLFWYLMDLWFHLMQALSEFLEVLIGWKEAKLS